MDAPPAPGAASREPAGAPLVGVVVVNHNGGDLVLDCLDALAKSEWPAGRLRVVMVDNASRDGSTARVRSALPDVEVMDAGANLGFAAGCNLGIRRMPDAEYIALVNSDAAVEPGWLAPLVDALESEPAAGAAVPRILFAGRFVGAKIESPARPRGRGDRRALGVKVSGIRTDGKDCWGTAQLVRGFWGPEHDPGGGPPFQWTNGEGHLRVPARPDGSLPACEVQFSAEEELVVTVTSGGHSTELVAGPAPRWFPVALGGEPFDVVNNAGSVLLDDGYGADRGYLEVADHNYVEPEDVFAWCGAAVLLSRDYLASAGSMEESFFLYYEDLDLAWRGRARAWRHVYVPSSVVRHVHSASSVEGSALFDHYVERNRLLTLTRNAPVGLAVTAAARFVLITGSYFRRDVVAPLARGQRPTTEVVGRRLRSFGAFARMLPGALSQRRAIRAAQQVPDAELLRGVVKNPR